MCCFSRAVEYVSDTNIFALASTGNRQFLVYQMRYGAEEDLAMILPVPTPPDSAEDSVRFIDLEEYDEFFEDLRSGFGNGAGGGFGGVPRELQGNILEVVEVGSYVASFVPTVADFERLDERFRLPEGTWDELPTYRRYGFVVFQLKSDKEKVHPMAFEFPRQDADRLFFPTVHIHDGEVHARAEFDHTLYVQFSEDQEFDVNRWQESPQLAESFVDIDRTAGIVLGDAHLYRHTIRGTFRNADMWV